jgi:glycine betaine/proline transport system permease protein
MAFELFPDFGTPIRDVTNRLVDILIVDYGDFFEAIANSILGVLVPLEQTLRGAPPLLILVLAGGLAYLAGRRISLVVLIVFATWLLGALGLWEQAMQTIAITIVSVVIAMAIGLPTGIIAGRSDRFRLLINPVLDLMQTIPSFVYLIPAAMLFGLGKVPAILATVIYATPPLVRLTDLGIRQVDPAIVEAARSFGASRMKILTSVQIPLALPSIMQGINQTMMMALAMVVIASMIGARGIGETVLVGLQRANPGMGLVGGIGIVILAIIFDRVSQAFGARLQAHRSVGS